MKYLKYNEEKGTILIKNARLSYPHLFEKWTNGEDEAKARYSGKFLLNKDTHEEEIAWLRRHLAELQREWFKGKIGSERLCFKNGEDSGKDEQEDCWVLSASESKRRPQVLDKDKSPLTEEDDVIYGGCYVHVLIRLWKQDHPKHGKRVNANLIGVQFHKDGDRFGEEPIDASEEFDDEDGDDRPSRSSRSKSKGRSRDDDDDLDDDLDGDDDDRSSRSSKRRSSESTSKTKSSRRRSRDDDDLDDDDF